MATAAEMSTTSKNPSPLSDGTGSDFSIVSRPNGSLHGPGEVTGGEPVDLNHLQFSLGALASLAVDGTIEEAVKIIEQLMRENEELKDSVHESNSLMKQQYQYLEDWRERNNKDQAFMKGKYHQIKTYVLDLKQRLKDRDAQIENLKAQLRQHEDKGSEVETAMLYGQLEEFKTKHSQAEQELEDSKEAYAKLSHDLHEHKLEVCQLEAQKMDVNLQLEKALREKAEAKDLGNRLSENIQVLTVEKRDLVAMNNELMAKTNGGSSDVEYVVVKTEREEEASVPTVDETQMSQAPPSGMSRSSASKPLSLTSMTRHDQAVSDLLIQLQAERTKVSSLTTSNNQQQLEVQKLQRELVDRERRMSESSQKMTSQISQVEAQLREKVDQLMQQLELVNRELNETRDVAGCEEVQLLKAQVMSLVHELQETQKQQDSALRALTQHRDRCKEVEAKATMYQEQLDAQRTKDDQLIETLRMSIISLENELIKEKDLHASKSRNLTELTRNFDQLCMDYHELLEAYEEYRAHQSTKAQAQSGAITVTKETMEKFDNLMAQLLTAEETLVQRDETIQDLKQEIGNNTETIGVLNAQAELYKADFEAERSARENKHEEKEQYKAQCDQLKLHNTQLQQELNSITSSQIQHMQQRHAGTPDRVTHVTGPPAGVMGPPGGTGHFRPGYNYPAGDGARRAEEDTDDNYDAVARPQSPAVPEYICPGCERSFPDEDSVRIHLDECLNAD